jgi:hypothetical protein
MSTIRFYKRAKARDDELESGIFEKPHKIVMKKVTVDGVEQEFPVKVYEPTKSVEPKCNPVNITMWAEGIKRKAGISE